MPLDSVSSSGVSVAGDFRGQARLEYGFAMDRFGGEWRGAIPWSSEGIILHTCRLHECICATACRVRKDHQKGRCNWISGILRIRLSNWSASFIPSWGYPTFSGARCGVQKPKVFYLRRRLAISSSSIVFHPLKVGFDGTLRRSIPTGLLITPLLKRKTLPGFMCL